MLPSILAKQLQQGIGDYIDTTFPMTNEPFKGSVRKMLETKDQVYREPYVAVRLPFRVTSSMPTCFEAIHPAYLPYVHQEKAFERLTGDDGRSTLVATGTGSGKTECFLYPILEYCYQHREKRGIKAIIIYPMNALASDQAKRIAELIYESEELRGNVTAGMYVGGEDHTAARMMSEHGVITDHETMLNSPPDILMTNYKMLDYLLVRPKDAQLWQDNDSETLKYIAVDELHTFDGAQGTDLACLIRRLKRRLGIFDGYLCCIGTSATMGSKDNNTSIIEYASEIFGEFFEKDAVIAEDRLSASEFFAGEDITEFDIPSSEICLELEKLINDDKPEEYINLAVKGWFPSLELDVFSDVGHIELGRLLKHHSFMQAVITLTGGNYYQINKIAEELDTQYPEIKVAPSTIINSLFALISHARTGSAGRLRPFLNVQVQLWMRELRRLVAKVDPDNVTYAISHDLNREQSSQYLPVVNCRECGATGWVSVLNERQSATITNLEAFYNMYFRGDDKIAMAFPYPHDGSFGRAFEAYICPDCLQIKVADESGNNECLNCGAEMIPIVIPRNKAHGQGNQKQYECPFCGSRSGLSLMGLRSATEISASVSQMFASRFNDDKKTLAFSDNVQDAAHRAGFFNSRTWRFVLRSAIQRYCEDGGNGQSLKEFQEGFISYWHEKLTREQFVSIFIPPNMTWMKEYEELIEKRELPNTKNANELIGYIEKRIKYEIMLEYGISGRTGRTLEKSGCSVAEFHQEDIRAISEAVQERTVNEAGVLTSENIEVFDQMVIGYLDIMRQKGAFDEPVFEPFLTKETNNSYFLTNSFIRWLPGQANRYIPRFPSEQLVHGRRNNYFESYDSKKYLDWISSCRTETFVDESNLSLICKYIVEEACKLGVVNIVASPATYKIYALNREKIFISNQVIQLRCEDCGAMKSVSEENVVAWDGASCQRTICNGSYVFDENAGLDYYGHLYSAGDIVRINAREHTGLLERLDREQLEADFKRSKDTQEYWDPNILSCTPTLEMGIDIGDLSSVILCSMPPAQSKFLQRAGRAGRKDGNALTLAIANARPHDLYFYADPLDMIAGNVTPPKIFLKASAVLERQFVAFCMDSWVKKGRAEGSIPEKVGEVLKKLDARPDDVFPFNFINYVQSSLSTLLHSFQQMFAANIDQNTRDELNEFARGSDKEKRSMSVLIIDAFESLKKQQDALRESIESLKSMISELEAKPQDSTYDEEIKELKSEQYALTNVVRSIGDKNIFNFLSDEGLLPNYAFPEAGIILRAVLYRKDEDQQANRKYEKMIYEYNRSASSAISEFAPNNNFYVGGHKLTIDQVDLATAQSAKWRLCPSCSHAELAETGNNVASCPQCGSPAWADAGQVRNMLRVQMVYSNMDYTKSLINDESDDRKNTFYCKQTLVDVDEEHDITSAYQMDNEEFPFGYEFVRKATLREINFGESDMNGESMAVAGIEEVRKGFKICKYCGKIQPDQGRPNHTYSCKTKKMPQFMQSDAYVECLFLYREFDTEILRLLIPATTMETTSVKVESFVAAFMLGMKEYFGNVDHLRATISEVPVPDADYRKQYLVIYDSVPGGTGYLKQLLHSEIALVEIFEKALHVMENCFCKDDPQKDGCYHCLYAYRQSNSIGNISRAAAIHMLKAILSGKDNIQKIQKLNDISVNPLFDSELEQLFVEAIKNELGAANVSDTVRNGKHSYYIKLDNGAWELEPQVILDASQGVKIKCKPDFVFWPVSDDKHLPVAVFTDGFTYHKDIVADDTLKRESIRRSGSFRVWSLSYKDVKSVFAPQGMYATPALEVEKMPSWSMMYKNTIGDSGADVINPAKLSPMDLLIKYLTLPDAEKIFSVQADAYSKSLLEPVLINNSIAFNNWMTNTKEVIDQTGFTDRAFEFQKTFIGSYSPRTVSSHLAIYAAVLTQTLQNKGKVSVCTVLDDDKNRRTDKYEEEWNGLWQFFNVMQFADEFVAVSKTGLEHMFYNSLPIVASDAIHGINPDVSGTDTWNAIKEMVFDDDALAFIETVKEQNIPVPDEANIGYELEGEDHEVIATLEIAWPDKKIGFLTSEQTEDKEKLEELGWHIVDLINASEISKLFE